VPKQDVLRVVSQGEPTVAQESVGVWRDTATVYYDQDRSYFESYVKNGATVTDNDNSPVRWEVNYDSDGTREFSINDGRTDSSQYAYEHVPGWAGNATYDEDMNDILFNYIKAPEGYISTTGDLSNQTLEATYTNVEVGWDPRHHWNNTINTYNYVRNDWWGGGWGTLGFWEYQSTGERAGVGQVQYWYKSWRSGFLWFYYNQQWGYKEWAGQTVRETQYDWTFDWKSTWNTIGDKRLTLQYQWTSTADDVYGKRPRFETYETEVKVVEDRNFTQWETEAVIEEQTVFTTRRIMDEGDPQPYGAFEKDTIHAGGSITIRSGDDVTVSGRVEAEGEALRVEAGGDVTIEGLAPTEGGENSLPALSELVAAEEISVSAMAAITISWGRLETDDGGAGGDSLITVTAGTDIELDLGELESLDEILLRADRNVTLGGDITAANLIDIQAGLGDAGRGGITGDLYVDLVTSGAGSDISLAAGSVNGDITLTGSMLTAADQVGMTASAGEVTHTGGLITAGTLYGRAAEGFSAQTADAAVDIELTEAGAIVLASTTGIVLTNLSAADGSITVQAFGDITATSVVTLGTSDRNDITLTTLADLTAGNTADLVLAAVSAGGLGDVTLNIQGGITQTGGAVAADHLAVTVFDGLAITTAVRYLSVAAQRPGDVSITQQGTDPLTLTEVDVTDGSLTVNYQGGNVTLTDVRLSTNKDTNDISVTAGGDILVEFLSAGVYAATAEEVPEPEEGAEAGITSLGDVTLTAGGRIYEASDEGVDLVADDLTLAAQTGITGFEIAVNELVSVSTAAGSIDLAESDGFGETTEGLTVTEASAANGSVTVSSENSMDVYQVIAGGTVRLSSVNGNLTVLAPNDGAAIQADDGVALSAGRVLQSYAFFTAPDLIDYRAGDYFDFDTADDESTGLPSAMTADTIILHNGSTITLDATLTATDLIEIVSDTNVFISGGIVGPVAEFIVTANGANQVLSNAYDEASGQSVETTEASGDINIQVTGIAATEFAFRAAKDIYVEMTDSFSLNGFIGGLEGFDAAANITIKTAGTLTVVGGIYSADGLIDLAVGEVAADFGSVFIADDIHVQAEGGITLNMLTDRVTAASTESGNIVLYEVDTLVADSVVAENGSVEISAGGDLTALDVRTMTDGAGKDVTLKSSDNIYVNYVEAGAASGAGKNASQVTFDAVGTISEPADLIDNDRSTEGTSMIDVAAWKIHFKHGEAMSDPVLVITEETVGASDELEIVYTAAADGTSDGGTTMADTGLPAETIDGSYILIAPEHDGSDIDLESTGSMIVLLLPTVEAQEIRLTAGGDLTIISDLDVGSGFIQLEATGNIISAGTITASGMGFSVMGDLTLTTDLDTLEFTTTGGEVVINEVDDLEIGESSTGGGDVSVTVGGSLSITGDVTGADIITFTSTGGPIIVTGTINAGASGQIILTAAGAIQGNSPAPVAGGDLSLTADGPIEIISDGDLNLVDITQLATDQPIWIQAAGSITVSDDLTVTGTGQITLSAGTTLEINGALQSEEGSITLTADGAITMGADGDITTDGATIQITVGGALTMTDETVIDAGDGVIELEAAGNITLGYGIWTTGDVEVTIESTGAAIIDGGDSPPDIIAPNALVILKAVSGIGSGNAIDTRVGSIRLINTGSGNISISELDDLVIDGVDQDAAGDVTITVGGVITVDESGTGISAGAGDVTLQAAGDQAGIELEAAITTTGGDVTLSTESGDIELAAGIEITGDGDIILTASDGSVLNAAPAWLQDGDEFSSVIEWALAVGTFTVDQATGQVVVANATVEEEDLYADNGTVLRTAEGPYLQTTGGGIMIEAADQAGQSTDVFTVSPQSLFIDAAVMAITSESGQPVYIISTAAVSLGAVADGLGVQAGKLYFRNLTGAQRIDQPYDADGENITFIADDIEINDTIGSDGGELILRPRILNAIIGIGTGASGDFHISQAELDRLLDGFTKITIGDAAGRYQINIGNAANPGQVTLRDPLVVMAPAEGGRINVYGVLVGLDDASFILISSETTTILHDATISAAGDVTYNEAVQIDGDVSITAGTSGAGNTEFQQSLNGDGLAGDDTLTLNANGDITFTGAAGGTDSLKGLTIGSADNVTFSSDLTVNGDLTIAATGNVVFEGTVAITGGGSLTITGASSVTFSGAVTVAGAITIEADEIDFNGGAASVQSVGNGVLTLRPATLSNALEIASPSPGVAENTLNITVDDLNALTGSFATIIFGRRDGEHAQAGSGAVRVGVLVSGGYTFTDPAQLYGGSLTVVDDAEALEVLKARDDVTIDVTGQVTILNQFTVEGDLTIYSASGRIVQQADDTDGDSAEALIVSSLTATAATGIELPWSKFTTIDVQNIGDGDISINEIAAGGDIEINRLAQTSGAGTGDIELTTEDGTITIVSGQSGVTTAGSGGIILTATGSSRDVGIEDVVTSTTGTIEITSGREIAIEAVVSATGAGAIELTSGENIDQKAGVTSNGGSITLTAVTEIDMTDGVTSGTTGTGAIAYTAGSDVTLSILSAAGTVSVTAQAGAITDGLTGEAANIIAATASLTAVTGIGHADDIDLDVTAVDARNTGAAGDITINEIAAGGDIEINRLAQTNASGTGTILVTAEDGSITVAEGESGVTVDGTGTVTLTTAADVAVDDVISVTTGTITINAGDEIRTSADIRASAAADIDLNAGSNVNQGADITSRGGDITVDSTAAGIEMADGAATDTNSDATITYTAQTGIALGSLEGLTTVTVTATTGTITDNTAAEGTNVAGDTVVLTAGTAIGGTGTGDIETDVASLTATASSGGVYIQEADGLTLTVITATGAGSDATITSDTGDITVVSVTAPDEASLTATAGAILDGNVTGADITAAGLALRAATGIGSARCAGNFREHAGRRQQRFRIDQYYQQCGRPVDHRHGGRTGRCGQRRHGSRWRRH